MGSELRLTSKWVFTPIDEKLIYNRGDVIVPIDHFNPEVYAVFKNFREKQGIKEPLFQFREQITYTKLGIAVYNMEKGGILVETCIGREGEIEEKLKDDEICEPYATYWKETLKANQALPELSIEKKKKELDAVAEKGGHDFNKWFEEFKSIPHVMIGHQRLVPIGNLDNTIESLVREYQQFRSVNTQLYNN